ncbi:hypothetical protein GCM10009689_18550 [Brevibacterium antiquum]|uniref:hypothetical protein n=1 Tax=Brevibacterium antiquum TaxID=234835 RepID=UPI0018DF50E8|nr:hypothetical protein [Brevibacterium antiquum]
MSVQNRVQSGIPTGGQWAESVKARPDVSGLDVKPLQAGDMSGIEFGDGDPDTEARIGKYFDDFNDGMEVGAGRPQSYVTSDDVHVVTTDVGFDVQIDRAELDQIEVAATDGVSDATQPDSPDSFMDLALGATAPATKPTSTQPKSARPSEPGKLRAARDGGLFAASKQFKAPIFDPAQAARADFLSHHGKRLDDAQTAIKSTSTGGNFETRKNAIAKALQSPNLEDQQLDSPAGASYESYVDKVSADLARSQADIDEIDEDTEELRKLSRRDDLIPRDKTFIEHTDEFWNEGADRSSGPASVKQILADLKKTRSEQQDNHDRKLDEAVMKESMLAKELSRA